jgi:polyhydroxyalkanoate synthesis regulator phasin
MTVKKRGPQDATRRNVQAANKRITALEKRVTQLERHAKARRA